MATKNTPVVVHLDSNGHDEGTDTMTLTDYVNLYGGKGKVMTTTVTAHFIRSNGTRVDFTGTLIREYAIVLRHKDGRDWDVAGVVPMVEVKTANGTMHAQRENATLTEAEPPTKRVRNTVRTMGNGAKVAVVTTESAPVKLTAAMFEGVKVGKLAMGDAILIEGEVGNGGIHPSTRVTKGRVVKVTEVTHRIIKTDSYRRGAREYHVSTNVGVFAVMAPTVIRKLKADS